MTETQKLIDGIKAKLTDSFRPAFLEILDESHQHRHGSTASHLSLTIVSTAFAPLPLIQRHRRIYEVLSEELKNTVHALKIHCWSEDEWDAQQAATKSPPCYKKAKEPSE